MNSNQRVNSSLSGKFKGSAYIPSESYPKQISNNVPKSTVTLWKSKYGETLSGQNLNDNENNVENDYIGNLKKQIYYMEMELNLMKEREKEIEKSGGFSKIFFNFSSTFQ